MVHHSVQTSVGLETVPIDIGQIRVWGYNRRTHIFSTADKSLEYSSRRGVSIYFALKYGRLDPTLPSFRLRSGRGSLRLPYLRKKSGGLREKRNVPRFETRREVSARENPSALLSCEP
mmetsp:Transcript_16891/g.32008  ORF Transcript_16891/g.32008 Transcript_16891/m.32008 type:complete len:118 (-) Transcript_16891:95-448(-)